MTCEFCSQPLPKDSAPYCCLRAKIQFSEAFYADTGECCYCSDGDCTCCAAIREADQTEERSFTQ